MQDNEKSLLKSENSHAADAYLRNRTGLSGASAKVFAQVANRFSSDVLVRWDRQTVNGKSAEDLAQLNVPSEQVIRIITRGKDAEPALTALEQAVMDGLEPDDADLNEPRLSGFEGVKDVRHGKPAAPGLAIASAHVWHPDEVAVSSLSEGYHKERNKILSALITSRQELQKLIAETSENDASLLASLFAEQLNQLDDPELLEDTDAELRLGLSAREAFAKVIQDHGSLHELEERVLNCLAGYGTQSRLKQLPPNPIILVARSLSPSDYSLLDPERVAGVILESDPARSLAIKLLKVRGIPCVSHMGAMEYPIRSGTPLILDGDSGLVVVKPDSEAYRAARALIRLRTEKKSQQKWEAENPKPTEAPNLPSHSIEHFAAAAKIAAELDIPGLGVSPRSENEIRRAGASLNVSPRGENEIRRAGASRDLPNDISIDKPDPGAGEHRRKKRMWDFFLRKK